jgi:hypothetical protein
MWCHIECNKLVNGLEARTFSIFGLEDSWSFFFFTKNDVHYAIIFKRKKKKKERRT